MPPRVSKEVIRCLRLSTSAVKWKTASETASKHPRISANVSTGTYPSRVPRIVSSLVLACGNTWCRGGLVCGGVDCTAGRAGAERRSLILGADDSDDGADEEEADDV